MILKRQSDTPRIAAESPSIDRLISSLIAAYYAPAFYAFAGPGSDVRRGFGERPLPPPGKSRTGGLGVVFRGPGAP